AAAGAVGGDVHAVAAGAAVAVDAAAVARLVHEDVLAVGCRAGAQPLPLALHQQVGQGDAAVGGQVLGERGVGGEVVDVQRVAVVLGQPGRDARLGQQPVEQAHGRGLVGGGEDAVERLPYDPYLAQVPR